MTLEHVVDPNGTQSWWLNGKLHREDGPAKIASDGSEYWFKNDIPHREDGPAVIDKHLRVKEWRINGKLHREDGPAYIRDDGYQEWYLNGFLHREDGPAIIYPDGLRLWFLNGNQDMSKIYKNGDGDGRCEISFTIPNGQSCFVDFWFDFKDKDTMTSTEGDKQSNDFIAFLKNAGCTKIELK